ncbi:MAG TPA: response regulator [Pyrinomonadaceae bacterium]|nr:response regulator [Pyrinomonadaceae bacterium]
MGRNDKRILIAEDNPELAGLIRIAFLGAPFRYDLANTGQEVTALHHLAVEHGDPYDLLVLDVAMPMKLGTTALREIRAEGDMQTPAIVFTGLPPDQTEAEVKDLNVLCVLYKPLGYDELMRHILQALEGDRVEAHQA